MQNYVNLIGLKIEINSIIKIRVQEKHVQEDKIGFSLNAETQGTLDVLGFKARFGTIF